MLPIEIVHQVALFMDSERDLYQMSLVSKEWCSAALSENVWANLYMKRWELEGRSTKQQIETEMSLLNEPCQNGEILWRHRFRRRLEHLSCLTCSPLHYKLSYMK